MLKAVRPASRIRGGSLNVTDEELTRRFDGITEAMRGMENQLVAQMTDEKDSLEREMHGLQNQASRLESTTTGMSFQLAGINRSLSETDSQTRTILQTQAAQQRAIDDLTARVKQLESK